MTPAFELSELANTDARRIWQYLVDQGSEQIANRVLAEIFDGCQRLSEFPGLGHVRLEIPDDNVKVWAVRSYLIIYNWTARPLFVLRIIHGARDMTKLRLA